MGDVVFIVPGTPVGKGRPRFAKVGGAVRTYTPEKTATYENLVKIKAQEAMAGRPVIVGPVDVSIYLVIIPPASWSQKKQRDAMAGEIHPTSRPDIDNVLKGVMDACNEVVFRDDKQVVNVWVSKRYGQSAQATVRVREL